MNRIYLLLLITLPSFHTIAQQTIRKVLFLGNSYTAVNNLPQMISELASSTGDSLIFDSNTPGGYTLEQHFNNTTSTSKIAAGGWDYVVMQEQSQLPAWIDYYSSGPAALSMLIKQHNQCARKLFYMTWGRKNGDASNCANWPPVCTYEGMDSLLRLRYIEMATWREGEISPVGAVWRYIRQNHPSIELYQPDESHPSVAGTYAAACSFYASIFKKDPSLITNNNILSPTESAIIRNAAKLIVYDSLSTWDFASHVPVPEFRYSIGPGINEVLFTNTSFNTDSFAWDFGDGNISGLEEPVHNYIANGTYNVTLTAFKCDLSQWNSATYQLPIGFCNHSPTAFPDTLFVCPGDQDTLWTQQYDDYQWFEKWGGHILAGETLQYIIPQPGNFYSVLTTANNCSEMSQEVYVDGFFLGPTVYFTNANGPFIGADSLCIGDTAYLLLQKNKPGANGNTPQWYMNGNPVGISQDTLPVTQSGDFYVQVTNTYCPGFVIYQSDTVRLRFVNCNIGIDEAVNDNSIKVFPVPATDFIKILSDGNKEKDFTLSDITGRILSRGIISEGMNDINISGLSAGIYFLKVGNSTARRIIKR